MRSSPRQEHNRGDAMLLLCGKKTIVIASLVAVGAVAISGVWHLYGAARWSLEAEKTLHAYGMVLDLVSAHVEKTAGQWPRSWDDLRVLSSSRESCGWRWPRDLDKIRERVRCDFSLACAEVARQSPDNFRAVEQIGPNFGCEWPEVCRLLAICRKHQGGGINHGEKNSSWSVGSASA
jgi:hypothetical protein